jgi:hypothetical protein
MAPLLPTSDQGISNIHRPTPAFISCPLRAPVEEISFEFIRPDSPKGSQQSHHVSEMHMLVIKIAVHCTRAPPIKAF